jgi:16S rRNA (adenine1518-N6/adenine1519-N6)-dimethyltransferase
MRPPPRRGGPRGAHGTPDRHGGRAAHGAPDRGSSGGLESDAPAEPEARRPAVVPKKRFGQNFLTDPRAARLIAEAATTPEGGTVLEIGPGTGALTIPLAGRAARVVAIERDPDLIPVLRERLAGASAEERVTILEGDATALDWPRLLEGGPRPHAVAGNVPYLITGRLIEMATNAADHIDAAVFMVQKEVADRLLARPGSKEYGALTVFTAAAFDVERVLVVRAGSFFPRPEVDSAVVKLVPVRPRRAAETEAFRAAVKAAFGMRRNAWRHLCGWSDEEFAARAAAAGISLDARGETLGVEQFRDLTAGA